MFVKLSIVQYRDPFKGSSHTGIGNPDINHLCSQCEKKDHYCLVAADNNKATCSITKTKTCVLTDNMLCWMKGIIMHEHCIA